MAPPRDSHGETHLEPHRAFVAKTEALEAQAIAGLALALVVRLLVAFLDDVASALGRLGEAEGTRTLRRMRHVKQPVFARGMPLGFCFEDLRLVDERVGEASDEAEAVVRVGAIARRERVRGRGSVAGFHPGCGAWTQVQDVGAAWVVGEHRRWCMLVVCCARYMKTADGP